MILSVSLLLASVASGGAPAKVATPPSDAYIGLSKQADGEIRHYNYGEQPDRGGLYGSGAYYLSSRDGGLTWTTVRIAPDMPNADRINPATGEFIRLTSMGAYGTYCIRTIGGDKGDRLVTKVSDRRSIMVKPPVFTSTGLIVVAAHGDVDPKGCYTYVSADGGDTWQTSNIVTSPDHTGGGFHRGLRWNHGAVEPTVVELNDGRLWMIMRTSQDRHYQAFSTDGGLTWSESEPSPFYGTITMPTIGRLADGRLLMIWTNTTPLPELPTANGVWDDVFTNRDVTHAAISDDDGLTWRGFRELMLDPMRNDSDYAVRGGGVDRGMHQSQFVETDSGMIVASIGQHPLHRAIIRFSPDWLLETERSCDFADGLASWSTHNYLKGIKGHCSYNRINGARLDTIAGRPALALDYQADSTLVCDTRGGVWNFPALRRGRLTAIIAIPEGADGGDLVINDRWMNPSDTVALHEGNYRIGLKRRQLGITDSRPHELTVDWDIDAPTPRATVSVDGRRRLRVDLKNPSLHGPSYAHFLVSAPGQSLRVLHTSSRKI